MYHRLLKREKKNKIIVKVLKRASLALPTPIEIERQNRGGNFIYIYIYIFATPLLYLWFGRKSFELNVWLALPACRSTSYVCKRRRFLHTFSLNLVSSTNFRSIIVMGGNDFFRILEFSKLPAEFNGPRCSVVFFFSFLRLLFLTGFQHLGYIYIYMYTSIK